MGKISPVSAKYIITANIEIDGSVEKPDVVGAIFGQTEGLLGQDLDLRELQRGGKIGRIDVTLETSNGKTSGTITVPSSLDQSETALIAAALETIQRIGPCNSKVKIEKIEDIRISKREFVVERAKDILKKFTSETPDSHEITESVANSVRAEEIKEYGKDRLPAGPEVENSDEIILVEGRADVINLLRNGIKNAMALNGTNVCDTIRDVCNEKTVTLFVDGDRGGELITKNLVSICKIDYVTRAPNGKELEELTKKEIHQALRSRVSVEELFGAKKRSSTKYEKKEYKPTRTYEERKPFKQVRKVRMSEKERTLYKKLLNDLIGTRGAFVLDKKLEIMGRIPSVELKNMLRELRGVSTVVMDGSIDIDTIKAAEKSRVNIIVASDSKVKDYPARVKQVTNEDL